MQNNYSIFIRSYNKDIRWLLYCLQSIHKFVKGFSEIVIVVPASQINEFKALNLTYEKLRFCEVYADDYLGQQITKLNAFQYCQSDLIMFVDSDCVFQAETTIEQFMKDGKPCILKTAYDTIDAPWQGITEIAMKDLVPFEYMRREPLLYHKKTLRDLGVWFNLLHNQTIDNFIISQPARHFSEFNLMGAYADKFESDKYYFLDTNKEELPVLNCKQYWSWSGLTAEERTEIENKLK